VFVKGFYRPLFAPPPPFETGAYGLKSPFPDGSKMFCLFFAMFVSSYAILSPGNANPSVDPCKGVTCQNGGKCDDSSGKCKCVGKYDGEFCQTLSV
jgi:hypothetical protein